MDSRKVRAGLIARFDLLSFLAGLVEKAISNWATITSFIGGGALMGYLAYLQNLPPVLWGCVFFGGLILVATLRAINAYSASRRALSKFTEIQADRATINPLQNEFIQQKINLGDFYSPFNRVNENKIFRKCEVFGPATVVLIQEAELRYNSFAECDFVIVPKKSKIFNATAFKNVEFRDCLVYRVTFYMTEEMAAKMKESSQGGSSFNFISGGANG